MNHDDRPTCWIIAGPNGAGKTTFALRYLPDVAGCQHFVNADLIAAGMAPLAPEMQRLAAGRIFLREVERHVTARHDFGFETTLAGRGYLRLVSRLHRAGWRVELIYLALPNVEMARMRVAERVRHGGHDIAATDVERRFTRSLANLFGLFASSVDRTLCLLNSDDQPRPIFEQIGDKRKTTHPEMLRSLQEWSTR